MNYHKIRTIIKSELQEMIKEALAESRTKHYNPEKRSWKKKSYKKGGEPPRELRDKAKKKADRADMRQHESIKEDIESTKVQSFEEALEALNHGLEEVQLAGPLQTYNKLSRKGVLSLEHIKRLKSELPEVLVALARLEELAMAQHAVSSALNQALKDISRHRKLN